MKTHLISASQTIIATMLVVFASGLTEHTAIAWDKAFIISLIIASVRAGVKVAIQNFAPVALGGTPKQN